MSRKDKDRKTGGQKDRKNRNGKYGWNGQDLSERAGTLFEKKFREYVNKFTKSRKGVSLADYDADEDHNNGTDIMLLNADGSALRIDPTCFVTGKDNMPFVVGPDQYKAAGWPALTLNHHPVWFGIRTANSNSGFPEPVVVVGVDMKGYECKKFLETLNEDPMPGMMNRIINLSREIGQTYQLALDPDGTWPPKAVRDKKTAILKPNPTFRKDAREILEGKEKLPEASEAHLKAIGLFLRMSGDGPDSAVGRLADKYAGPSRTPKLDRMRGMMPSDGEDGAKERDVPGKD